MQWSVMVILQEIELHFGPVHMAVHVHDEGLDAAQTCGHAPLEDVDGLRRHGLVLPLASSMSVRSLRT